MKECKVDVSLPIINKNSVRMHLAVWTCALHISCFNIKCALESVSYKLQITMDFGKPNVFHITCTVISVDLLIC